MRYCSMYVSAPSRDEAIAIGRAVVGERLAACANVLDAATSIYHWQGQVEEDAEAVLILKTRKDLVAAATDRIRAAHSYDVPCVVVWDIVDGDPAYLDWIGSETAGTPDV